MVKVVIQILSSVCKTSQNDIGYKQETNYTATGLASSNFYKISPQNENLNLLSSKSNSWIYFYI